MANKFEDLYGNTKDPELIVTQDQNGLMLAEDKTKLDTFKDFREIPYTWAELQTKIKADNLEDIHVGDYKDITLTTGEKVRMEVAGINTYKGYGDIKVKSHIDFISKDCLKTTYKMRDTDTNNGTASEKNSFRASPLFTTLNTTIFNTLPSEVKNMIVDKRLVTSIRYDSSNNKLTQDNSWEWNTFGKLWLPSEIEVFGHCSWSTQGYETGQYIQYPIFAKYGMKRIVKHLGYESTNRCLWWLCSAYAGNSSYFCYVNDDGHSGNWAGASNSLAVPLCFRIS